jgi:hypothetical protein
MGGVLGSWLAACGPVWGALHRGLGRAEAAGLALVLLVDTEDAALRALPWELLSGSASEPGWEAAGRVVVARLATGIASARPLRGVAAWSPDPTDATTAALLRTHEAERLATGLRAVDEAEPGVLLVAAHGHLLADSLGVSLGDGDSSAVALAEGAAARWAQASGVVLGVCDGAAGTTREIDNLAGRLVALGVPWVVAPAMPVALEAMSAFVAGFYLALSEGRGAALAVAAGRRAIRALSHPHPSHRAHGLQVWVGGRAALSVALPALEGWPQPGASAAGWLVAADDLATTRGDGPVGLEHLLDSLSEGLDGPAMELLHRAEPWRERLRQARLARTRRELVGTDTARIKVIKEGLAPGFSAADLALGLGASPGVPWALAPDSPLGPQTVLTQGTRAAEPGNALVVLGGPEDGRAAGGRRDLGQGRAEWARPWLVHRNLRCRPSSVAPCPAVEGRGEGGAAPNGVPGAGCGRRGGRARAGGGQRGRCAPACPGHVACGGLNLWADAPSTRLFRFVSGVCRTVHRIDAACHTGGEYICTTKATRSPSCLH